MDVFSPTEMPDVPWRQLLASFVVLGGLVLAWRGLRGGTNGERGLLRRRAGALGRCEGWRLFVFGLALAGAGAGWFWEARWLLVLSLGIGYVEVQEASWVINAWRWDGGGAAAARRAATSGAQRGLSDAGGRSVAR